VAPKTKDDQTLRKYLLGDMSVEEQEALEFWLMSEEEAYDLLVAAEDDLIDDSLKGRLNKDEGKRFNQHFLAAPERQRKLQFGRSFQRFIKARTKGVSVTAGSPAEVKRPSVWSTILDSFRYRPQVGYALSVLVVAAAVGGVWSAFRAVRLERELRSATERVTTAERDRDQIKRQLSETQALTEKLQVQLQASQQTVGGGKSASTSPTLLAINLLPGISRSSTDTPKITVTASSRFAQLNLILLDDSYESYRATLLDSGGKELLTKDRMAATASGNGKAIVLTVPAELLSSGEYTVSLAGISDSRTPENINSFYFRAFRQ